MKYPINLDNNSFTGPDKDELEKAYQNYRGRLLKDFKQPATRKVWYEHTIFLVHFTRDDWRTFEGMPDYIKALIENGEYEE